MLIRSTTGRSEATPEGNESVPVVREGSLGLVSRTLESHACLVNRGILITLLRGGSSLAVCVSPHFANTAMAEAEPESPVESIHAKQVVELESIGLILSMSMPAAREELAVYSVCFLFQLLRSAHGSLKKEQLQKAIADNAPLEVITGDYENMTADDVKANFFVLCNVLRYPPFQVRAPSLEDLTCFHVAMAHALGPYIYYPCTHEQEARIIFEAFLRKNKKLQGLWTETTTKIHILKLQRLWSCLRK